MKAFNLAPFSLVFRARLGGSTRTKKSQAMSSSSARLSTAILIVEQRLEDTPAQLVGQRAYAGVGAVARRS